jgi:hypothetical protein
MTPDPAKPLPPSPRAPMAPPYVDEDANEAAVEQGLAAAEDEVRDAVADGYEEGARRSEASEEMMDDIDYAEADADETAPELTAMHRERIPEQEEEG